MASYYDLTLKDGSHRKLDASILRDYVHRKGERVSCIAEERLAQINELLANKDSSIAVNIRSKVVDWSLEEE